jgi:hypothetical protein
VYGGVARRLMCRSSCDGSVFIHMRDLLLSDALVVTYDSVMMNRKGRFHLTICGTCILHEPESSASRFWTRPVNFEQYTIVASSNDINLSMLLVLKRVCCVRRKQFGALVEAWEFPLRSRAVQLCSGWQMVHGITSGVDLACPSKDLTAQPHKV